MELKHSLKYNHFFFRFKEKMTSLLQEMMPDQDSMSVSSYPLVWNPDLVTKNMLKNSMIPETVLKMTLELIWVRPIFSLICFCNCRSEDSDHKKSNLGDPLSSSSDDDNSDEESQAWTHTIKVCDEKRNTYKNKTKQDVKWPGH